MIDLSERWREIEPLIDTLFDLPLTAAMLESMAGVTLAAPISTLVNTHANGDHCCNPNG